MQTTFTSFKNFILSDPDWTRNFVISRRGALIGLGIFGPLCAGLSLLQEADDEKKNPQLNVAVYRRIFRISMAGLAGSFLGALIGSNWKVVTPGVVILYVLIDH
jgi:hypothetical protein